MEIRKATLADIPAIQAIADVAFRDTYKEILSSEQMEYMMQWMYSEDSLRRQMLEEANTFYIMDGKGYVSFRPDGKTDDASVERYHLEKLYVLPNHHGEGLGRLLFEKIVAEVKTRSAGRAVLELNVNRYNKALQFYEHMGMYRAMSGDFHIGNGYYMNDYIMRLEIPN